MLCKRVVRDAHSKPLKNAQGKSQVEVFLQKTPVEIGLHYTGKPQGFADTVKGIYWTAMAPPDDDERPIQKVMAPAISNQYLKS